MIPSIPGAFMDEEGERERRPCALFKAYVCTTGVSLTRPVQVKAAGYNGLFTSGNVLHVNLWQRFIAR